MHAAQAWYDDCLVLTRATGDKNAIANAIYNDSFPLVVGRTDMARALPLLDEALGFFRELDVAPGIARCLWGIGNVHHFLQDYDAAVPPLEESIELFRKLGQGFGLGWSLHTRALVAINLGDPTTAQPLVTEALGLFSKAGDVSGIMILLDDSAQIARLREQRLRSLRLAGAAAGMQARSGAQLATLANAIGGRPVAVAEDAEERKAFEAGQAMTPEDAVAYALDQG